MKAIIISLAIAISGFFTCCNAQTNKETHTKNADKVRVYYFHFTQRCATCQAVEKVSKEAVEDFYGNKVIFSGYNLDETVGESVAKSLDVSGQTLLIIFQGQKINLTNEGFMYARSNPEKLKQILKQNIDSVL